MYSYGQHHSGASNGNGMYSSQQPQQPQSHSQPSSQHAQSQPQHGSQHQPPSPYGYMSGNGVQSMRSGSQDQSVSGQPSQQPAPAGGYGQQSLPPQQSGLPYSNGGSNGMSSAGGLPVMPHSFPFGGLPQTPSQQVPSSSGQRCVPSSFCKGDWVFTISVGQQPIRARMCGFGDKDRRPITPPPCVKLIVKNKDTGEEININEIDSSFYVLTVDLWSGDGSQEVNLVRHSSNSPAMSISASSVTSYPPQPERAVFFYQPSVYGGGQASMPSPLGAPMYPGAQGAVQPVSATPALPPTPIGYGVPSNPYVPPGVLLQNHPNGMFTRNLIGSLAVNAFRLEDQNNKLGLWFVLQDLSVRTEGTFRLKMSFIDVSDQSTPSGLNYGNAPVLATCYSDPFTVYSAKKFPGVIESTDLSKAFARQGIKIPIRKDSKPVANQDEFDNDDQDPASGNAV